MQLVAQEHQAARKSLPFLLPEWTATDFHWLT